jgi:DnaK suppressor protein
MSATARMPQERLQQIENLLASKRREIAFRFEEDRKGVLVEREPDDEGAQANNNYSREFALTIMERDRINLAEIERAIARLKKGEYGICSFCGKKLQEARLRAIPWATVCVPCTEGVRSTPGETPSTRHAK